MTKREALYPFIPRTLYRFDYICLVEAENGLSKGYLSKFPSSSDASSSTSYRTDFTAFGTTASLPTANAPRISPMLDNYSVSNPRR